MTIIEQLHQQAKLRPRRIIFPEQQDSRVQSAALTLAKNKLLTPVLLSAGNNVADGCEIFSEHHNHVNWLQKAELAIVDTSKNKGIRSKQAKELLQDPIVLAAILTRIGYVDGGVAGSVTTSAEVLRAGIKYIGLTEGAKLVSSTFLMELTDGRTFSYGDCVVVAAPDAQQLAKITIQCANNHIKLIGQAPNIALLSFSTKGSADHPKADLVREAVALVKQQAPELNVDGELQFDAALVPSVAKKKAPKSGVAGQANVFIFPDLNAANIACKITEHLGGANAIGPILQGLAKPWVDLLRGCKAIDIVSAAVIASTLS